MEEIIKSLESIDLTDNDDIHSYSQAVNLWIAISLVIAVVISIVAFFVWHKVQRRGTRQEQQGEEIEMTITATARGDTPKARD